MKKIITFAFILSALAGKAMAQQGFSPMKDTTTFIRQLTELNKKLQTIESDFTQEKLIAVMDEKIISKGHFCFKKQNKIRWEYTSPFTYKIVINNNNMWMLDGKKANKYNMQSNKMFKTVNELMTNTVQGNVLGNKDYKAKFLENAKYVMIELTPRQKETKTYLKYIQLYFDKKQYEVVKVKMVEPSDDYTLIEFSNRQRNTPISDEKFTVK